MPEKKKRKPAVKKPAVKKSLVKKPTAKKSVVKKAAAKKTGGGNMRDKINVLAMIEALEQHVLGQKEMTATQVNAALALLKKTMPDMSEPIRKLMKETETSKAHEDALKELE